MNIPEQRIDDSAQQALAVTRMVMESQPHTKEASNLASWQVQVPAEGAVTLTWRVQVRH